MFGWFRKNKSEDDDAVQQARLFQTARDIQHLQNQINGLIRCLNLHIEHSDSSMVIFKKREPVNQAAPSVDHCF